MVVDPDYEEFVSLPQDGKPFVLVLPDMDGIPGTNSSTSKGKWDKFALVTDLHALEMDVSFAGGFSDLVSFVKGHLEHLLPNAPPERPIYLLGEGFGAVLALAVALESKSVQVNRLVLVNPSTSFMRSTARQMGLLLADLPPPLYSANAPFALAPALAPSPDRMLPMFVEQLQRAPNEAAANARKFLMGAVEQLQQISRSLPPATLRSRLLLLEEGVRQIEDRLEDVQPRTMVVAGGQDLVLPSAEEAANLKKAMPRAFPVVLPSAGHAILSDPQVDLLQLMRKEGFLINKRVFTSPIRPGQREGFGLPGPVEMPTKQEVMRTGQDYTATLRRLLSPVFFSTLEDGTVVEGVEGLTPLMQQRERPLLFVGNHQLYALDMNIMVEELALKQNRLLRGLAHPILFAQEEKPSPSAGGDNGTETVVNPMQELEARDKERRKKKEQEQGDDNSNTFKDLQSTYRTFGAVPVSPTSFFRLLSCGEAVLLYPGGVREGLKRRNEKYELFWPTQSEFIRMAARFEAVVIPVSSIGAEDSVLMLQDANELLENPFLGRQSRELEKIVPRARKTEVEGVDESFVPPLIAPSVPGRLYFRFGKPIRLTKNLKEDREAADREYANVKAAVDDNITWLVRKREQDPYRDFVPRMLYENNPLGPRRQAPTFKLK